MTLALLAEEQLCQIVGAAHVRAAVPEDAVGDVFARLVVEPGREREVAEVLRCANDEGLSVIPRGGGTKLAWGNPPTRADLILSLARLNRVVEHAWADLTVTIEAGCTMGQLQQTLSQHGQRLAIDVLRPERATVGGILSTNESGALRLRYGGLRDLVIGATLALADGTVAASGGKVVKNVAGYDLPKLATGALGTLGIITQATFRLHPVPAHAKSLTLQIESAEAIQDLVLAVLDSQLIPSALQARMGSDAMTELDVLFEGTEVGVDAQEAALRDLATGTLVVDASDDLWNARQRRWPAVDRGLPAAYAVAKLSILPTHLAYTASTVSSLAFEVAWRLVVQATGIGWLWLEGAPEALAPALAALRAALESNGGSLVVTHQPNGAARLDAWGNPGDALPLMRALKQQFDPKGTLNPGRFVGGI
jgi:glycolate oxidase FAD binding subunit